MLLCRSNHGDRWSQRLQLYLLQLQANMQQSKSDWLFMKKCLLLLLQGDRRGCDVKAGSDWIMTCDLTETDSI